MAINRSNIKLQVTRGNKMNKDKFLTEKQQTLPENLQKEIIKFKKDKSGDKLVNKMYGGQVMKRAGGGMSYQLYGGTSKNIRDGNKEVSQFYDKGGN